MSHFRSHGRQALHGGGGGHHHHHGGGGGWRGPGWGYGWGPQTVIYDPYPPPVLVDVMTDDNERKLTYVLSLPKAQQKAAYMKLFGKLPPEGLGGILSNVSSDVLVAGAAVAAYFLFFRRKR